MSGLTVACFNELSPWPPCKTEAEADARIKNFVAFLKQVRDHTGITKVRHDGDLTSIRLTETMSVQDYCNKTCYDRNNPLPQILMNMFVKPHVDTDDVTAFQSYMDTAAEVEFDGGACAAAEGFNAAYCQRTFCVGFDSSELWHNDFYKLIIKSGGKTRTEQWACLSSPLFFSNAPEHVGRRPAFDSWLQSVRPVRLVESALEPAQKKIDLQTHHGKDKMVAHARSLCNSPYVEGVLATLPFRRSYKNYVHKITDDGLVDIVMWWEEDGYSLRVKTTGRNVAETKEIASRLTEKYGRAK